MAWNFFAKAEVIAAVAEEAKKLLRLSHPEAVHNVRKIADGIDRNPMAAPKSPFGKSGMSVSADE